MAKKEDRFEDNVKGPWYVDRSCILCSLCAELAPTVFKESPQADHDHVYKQPETEEELAQASEALRECPVEAIGSDGT